MFGTLRTDVRSYYSFLATSPVSRTMAQQFLEQLPTLRKDELPIGAECMVCREQYGTIPSDNGTIEHAVLLPCSHHVGSECIYTWLSPENGPGNSCPLCRTVFFPMALGDYEDEYEDDYSDDEDDGNGNDDEDDENGNDGERQDGGNDEEDDSEDSEEDSGDEVEDRSQGPRGQTPTTNNHVRVVR